MVLFDFQLLVTKIIIPKHVGLTWEEGSTASFFDYMTSERSLLQELKGQDIGFGDNQESTIQLDMILHADHRRMSEFN